MLWDLLLFTIDHILFLCALPTLNVNAYVMQLSHFYCIYEVLVGFFCQALSRVMNSVLQRFDGVSHFVCEETYACHMSLIGACASAVGTVYVYA
jgi:hypothetical protein